jgi:hypothetical protein
VTYPANSFGAKAQNIHMWTVVTLLGLWTLFHGDRTEGAIKRPFPQKNKLPITPASFCSGEPSLMKKLKQDFKEELKLLCDGPQATALFSEMVATAYNGTNVSNYKPIFIGPSTTEGWIDIKISYSMRLKKSVVKALRAEEFLNSPKNSYIGPELKLNFITETPPPSDGDADTTFMVTQKTVRDSGNRQFNDTSVHTLKLYRLIPNNFDFMLAGRTLNQETPLFKRSVTLRAAMTDPSDPEYSVVTTVMGFTISDQRDQADRVEDIFVSFIKNDMLNVFNFHQQKS